MSENVAHVGRETTTEALGKTWRFGRWTRAVWDQLATWAKTVLPDPIQATVANIDKLVLKDAEIVRELMRKDEEEKARVKKENAAEVELAKKENREPVLKQPILMSGSYSQIAETLTSKALDKASSYLSFNSPELNSLLQSVTGSSYLFYLLLKPNHPDMTEEDAYDVLMSCDQAEVQRILKTVRGEARARPNELAPAAQD